MRLFIPPLKTQIVLTKQWNFDLICEPRNRTLWDLFHSPPTLLSIPSQVRRVNSMPTQLDIGDVLIVDRIYLRQGNEMFDSVTFRGQVKKNGVVHKVRFWVRLADTHNIEGEVTLP